MDTHVWWGGSWHRIDEASVHALLEGAAFVTWYDTIETDQDSFAVTDLAIPAFLDATPAFRPLLSRDDGRDIRDVLAVASSYLNDVPKNKDLWEWDIDEEALRALFQATTGGRNRSLPQFGPARCTKLLHRKRPRAIPIIDSWTRDAWSCGSQASWTTDEMVRITKAMQSGLRDRCDEWAHVSALIDSRWSVRVSALRAYDVLAYLWNRERHHPHGRLT